MQYHTRKTTAINMKHLTTEDLTSGPADFESVNYVSDSMSQAVLDNCEDLSLKIILTHVARIDSAMAAAIRGQTAPLHEDLKPILYITLWHLFSRKGAEVMPDSIESLYDYAIGWLNSLVTGDVALTDDSAGEGMTEWGTDGREDLNY